MNLLSDAIDEYLRSRRLSYKANTIRNDERAVRNLLASAGNIQVRSIEARHVEVLLIRRREVDGLEASSLNTELNSLRAFFNWCLVRRLISANANPMAGMRQLPVMPKDKLFIPQHDFERILDCATHPRDRIAVALGLYLFVRQSELATMKLGDIHFDRNEITVRVHKSSKIDDMPICQELDTELRRWLRWWAEHSSTPLDGSWWLTPAKAVPNSRSTATGRFVTQEHIVDAMRPTVKLGRIQDHAKRVLEAAGYSHLRGEGFHALRRSGARALYDHLVDNIGHDGSVRTVQAMLHHSSLTTTEKYLRIEADERRRNRDLAGRSMFAVPGANVVSIRRARGEADVPGM